MDPSRISIGGSVEVNDLHSGISLPTPASTLSGLRSDASTQRLEQIASLRSRGIGEHIDLPQLVVCGDQSAGKSSVLEGITGLPFPRQDGLCTRFATEIVLTHAEEPMNIRAEIIPHRSRSEASNATLKSFSRDLQDFEDLPNVITDAAALMGVRGSKDNIDGPAFAHDILRISVSGKIGLHLSVVDLPGLISVPSEEQTEDDLETVHALVDAYTQNPRTIILAVVQASNDIANQAIIQKSRKYDPKGQRTVGIITKPDLVNEGTEGRIARLARNQDTTKLKLGFFLLKNPTPAELLAGITPKQREEREAIYFSTTPWKELFLDHEKVGIANLRRFLQQLLDQHMARELPFVKTEIKKLLRTVERQLDDLGEERPTVGHLRTYLSRLAMRFHVIAAAALHGNYDITDVEFFSQTEGPEDHIRARAFLHFSNTKFANDMRNYGHTMKVGEPEAGQESDSDVSDVINPAQREVSEVEMRDFILLKYRHTRGRELPGASNHILLTELFRHQSKGWKKIAENHVADVAASLELFVKDVIKYITTEEKVQDNLLRRTDQTLFESKEAARVELDRLSEDKNGTPITYNHYFTDNVQNARQATTRGLIKHALEETSTVDYNSKLHISNTTVDAEKLLGALQRRVLVDMEQQACSEARQGLLAYYKVARKTFVDNVCIQVIERHLVRGLPGIFSPERVAGYTDDELLQIAGEDERTLVQRRHLQMLKESLLSSLEDLRN